MLNFINDYLLIGTDRSSDGSPWVLLPVALLLALAVLRRQSSRDR